MADGTGIEWTDATWNPIRGCSRVSEGCRNCYAEKVAARFNGEGLPYEGLTRDGKWNGIVRVVEKAIGQPLRWKRPRKIFVNSMSDLFHESLPFADVLRIFEVMEKAKHHTFQVLTKRPQRAFDFCRTYGIGTVNKWPSNVWLGVSVENQVAADERIPWLLETPAAVRFLSCEPLIGPVDLVGWGDKAADSNFAAAPATWAEFVWPEWIPVETRGHIEKFWSASCGCSPESWLRDNVGQRMPATGARIKIDVSSHGWGTTNKMATDGVEGRFIHLWNNIGKVITDDGRAIPTGGGFGSGWLSNWLTPNGDYRPKLHWVIAGGESGPGARPMHFKWALSLRDQCAAAGVAFFHKQNGEWQDLGPKEAYEDNGGVRPDGNDTRWVNLAGGHGYHGDSVRLMQRVGKKAAGSLLAGAEHKAFPEVANG